MDPCFYVASVVSRQRAFPARLAVLGCAWFAPVMACACAGQIASSEPAVPPASSTAPAATAQAPAPEPYSRFADPLFLAFDDEANVYVRVVLARLWVQQASWEAPGQARQARVQQATSMLKQAEEQAAAQTDPCAAGVVVAKKRIELTKNEQEQQYLRVVTAQGDQAPESRLIDQRVHLLRDELAVLDSMAARCPGAMFDDVT